MWHLAHWHMGESDRRQLLQLVSLQWVLAQVKVQVCFELQVVLCD
jgi:hypothetical protein